jgi:hypothetical protein
MKMTSKEKKKKNEDDLNKTKKWRRPQKKNEDDLKNKKVRK